METLDRITTSDKEYKQPVIGKTNSALAKLGENSDIFIADGRFQFQKGLEQRFPINRKPKTEDIKQVA